MGAIFDRSREHLGVSDKAVIAVRRFLLTSVKEFNTGKEPPHILRDVERNWFPHIDCFAYMLGRECAVAAALQLFDGDGRKRKSGVLHRAAQGGIVKPLRRNLQNRREL